MMMRMMIALWFGLLGTVCLGHPSFRPFFRALSTRRQVGRETFLTVLRGGASVSLKDQDLASNVRNEKEDHQNVNNEEAERYSRQVYTLGARAQGLIRSSTIYLDGPPSSGLLYEIAKNLALSGVGHIVLLIPQHDENSNLQSVNDDSYYHHPTLDDLGSAYQRAARAELRPDANDDDDNAYDDWQLLEKYIQRLNPFVAVTRLSRSEWMNQQQQSHPNQPKTSSADASSSRRRVLVAVDRPYPTLLELNAACRCHQENHHPCFMVAVETAGIFGQVFCDFGPNFVVYDADGERSLTTPLDRMVEVVVPDEATTSSREEEPLQRFLLFCMDGEKHDVSKGDVIQFQRRNGTPLYFPQSEQVVVTKVYTPFKLEVTLRPGTEIDEDGNDGNNNKATCSSADYICGLVNDEAVSFQRIKIPQSVSFDSLETALAAAQQHPDSDLVTPSDLDKSFDPVRRSASLACFVALSRYTADKRQLPGISGFSADDFAIFWNLVVQEMSKSGLTGNHDNGDSPDQKKLKKQAKRYSKLFFHTCAAKFAPLQAVFGAIGAQEALKAATGLYFPVRQFLLHDCDEVMDEDIKSVRKKKIDDARSPASSSSSKNNKESELSCARQAPGLRHIIGDGLADKLQSQRVFVVGAGAIGCEILKNLASMGIATGESGRLYLTDMDTIEKSNLSRQLLFRDSDVGKFKSAAAHEAVLRFNPLMCVESYSTKVGSEQEEATFDVDFWSTNVDVILNALDNMEARLYMDGKCVAHQKALVDAGTLGPKGNVQVVVPHQSESYASSVDPPEPAIPVCTLKNFPYAISHTIQWGRDLFEGLFERRPRQANEFVNSLEKANIDELVSTLLREKGDEAALETAEELREDSDFMQFKGNELTEILQSCLDWASKLAYKLYFKDFQDLLLEHPVDSVDEEGEPFWSGSRRPPILLFYQDASGDPVQEDANKNLVEFVRVATRLRAESIIPNANLRGIDCSCTSDQAISALRAAFEKNSFAKSDDNLQSNQPVAELVRARLSENEILGSLTRLTAAEFEKDDDSNGHVAFVTAASNLRAIAYGIPPVDAMETRRVAGNIVPAMITTTAFVSALSCVELVKLTQSAPLKRHRNAFINLALPFFAFTQPLPALQIPGLNGRQYTLWDRIEVVEGKKAAARGGLTMRSLIRKIKKEKKVADEPDSIEVASIAYGPYMLYMNFLHDDDDSVLDSPIWQLLTDAITSSDDFDSFSRSQDRQSIKVEEAIGKYVDLSVSVEDIETGQEVELPPVRVQKYTEH